MNTSPGLPVVAIVGRPNVGKSTLMNRILGRREAIVEERPGVTRDRKEVVGEWQGREFLLVDTGGWLVGGDDLDVKVSAQSEQAMRSAEVVMMVVDTVTGVTEEDARVAAVLQRLPAPVLLVANKVDDVAREGLVWEFMELGLGEPWPVSALHGRGTGDLLDELVSRLPAAEDDVEPADEDEGERVYSVAVVGRPNVGKSTLFNRLIGEDRAVVHDMPGTTRDTVDTVVDTPDGPIRFVDTAGMRRKSKIDEGTEYYSFVRALQAVDRSDVALLVIDATEGVTHQDQRLAERIDVAGCPVIVLLNKWELLDAEERSAVTYQVSPAAGLHRRERGAQDQRAHRQGRAEAAARARRRDLGVPAAHPDQEGERRGAGRAVGAAGAARRPHPLRDAGCDGPAHVHALLEQGAAAHVAPLHRAEPPGGLRPRRHSRQAPGPAPVRLAVAVTLCVLLWARLGKDVELAAYEDAVLALLPDHGGRLLQRVRPVGGRDEPTEVQLLQFPERGGARRVHGRRAPHRDGPTERDAAVDRTEVLRVNVVG